MMNADEFSRLFLQDIAALNRWRREHPTESINLTNANLRGAYLWGACGINPVLSVDLLMLLDQPGMQRAYKLVDAEAEGPFAAFNGYSPITYEIGKNYEVSDANTDADIECGAGVSLGTLAWCAREWKPGYRILIAEFGAADIAAIPAGGNGKFRVHRCRIVGEKNLVEIGLVPTTENPEPAA
jgi:hypothetical protein